MSGAQETIRRAEAALSADVERDGAAAENAVAREVTPLVDDVEAASKRVEKDVATAAAQVESEIEPLAKRAERELERLAKEAERELQRLAKEAEREIEHLAEDVGLRGRPSAGELAERAHHALLARERFPSASECAVCHPHQYREWSGSPHAYAQISPIFNSMQGVFIKRSAGTNGDFCIRCHTTTGMALGEPLFESNEKRSAVAREGVTCVTCHRIRKAYRRVSGRPGYAEGPIYDPMYGPIGDQTLKRVLEEDHVAAAPDESGPPIHDGADPLWTFDAPIFCSMCHDVNSQNEFRLEEAFTQYLSSPAYERGETCQDCHMGKTPGIKSGYPEIPIAVIEGTALPARKHAYHYFAGPDYPIVHPALFPHSTFAENIAELKDWLEFDYVGGWGNEIHEAEEWVAHHLIPDAWKTALRRAVGRLFLDRQLATLAEINVRRYQLMRRGYQFGELVVDQNDEDGLRFRVEVRNGTDGHSTPTGFDAERLVFLHAVVRNAEGATVFESGDRDPNGDVRDMHSRYVHDGVLPPDEQLFSLQSEFLLTNLRGGEQEHILTVNFSPSPLPFIRPDTTSALLRGNPSGTRKHVRSLPPNGSRWAEYEIDADALDGKGPYRVELALVSQMVPANLVGEVGEVGFLYRLSTRKVADRIVKGALSLWTRKLEIGPAGSTLDLTPTEDEILHSPPQLPRPSWVQDLEQLF